VRQDGSHTHVGGDHGDTNEENLAMFVNGLHDQLVNNRGLSWAIPSKEEVAIVPSQPVSFTEGRVQRGHGNGGPTTEKPAIVAKPQFPSPRIIREDLLP
jgi:hypothetical protein